MNPDRMVIGEAMRTFTYLNLYGYLTDAVIVNRVFPAEVGDYFAAWRQRPGGAPGAASQSAFAPVPVLCAPYLRPGGARRRDARPSGRRAVRRPRPRRRAARRAHPGADRRPRTARRLRLTLPFADKGDDLAEEDRPGADRRRRRPAADYHAAPRAGRLAARPAATFEAGALEVSFDGASDRDGRVPTPARLAERLGRRRSGSDRASRRRAPDGRGRAGRGRAGSRRRRTVSRRARASRSTPGGLGDPDGGAAARSADARLAAGARALAARPDPGRARAPADRGATRAPARRSRP